MNYRRRLWQHAIGNYGLVTTRDAAELGVPTGELPKLAARGGMTHVAYGVYRLDDAPHTERDQFAEAVLRVGPEAYLTHDAVLALHELALVNPKQIRVATPRRTRAKHPPWIRVIRRDLTNEHITVYEGIRSTTVARALVDCRTLVMRDRLTQAAEEARVRGLLTREEHAAVLTALTHPSAEIG